MDNVDYAREAKGLEAASGFFNPEYDGHFIGGEVIDIGTFQSQFGQGSLPLLSIQSDGKVLQVVANVVLARELLRENPAIGDKVVVKFCGFGGKNKRLKLWAFKVIERAKRSDQPPAESFKDRVGK